MNLLEGTTGKPLIAARFQMLRRLGPEWGLPGLWEAEDTARGERVVLKRLRRVAAEEVGALFREFNAVGDIEHAHLLPLYDVIQDGDDWFLSTPPLPAYAFTDFCRTTPDPSSRRLASDEARLREVMPQLASALSLLHESGRVHADIRPSTVRVDDGGRVRLVTHPLLGSWLGDDEDTDRSTLSEILTHMSPELAAGRRPTAASDWYEFGILLYEALTGRPPFHGEITDLVLRRGNAPPPSIRNVVPEVPEDLELLALELLDPEPERRPGPESVLERLRRVPLRWEPITLPPPPLFAKSEDASERSELTRLDLAFDALRVGSTIVVSIDSPSASARTALVDTFISRHREGGGLALLRARCHTGAPAPPRAIDALLAGLRVGLAGVDDDPSISAEAQALSRMLAPSPMPDASTDGVAALAEDFDELRCRTFATLRHVITRIGDDEDVVIVLDDAHHIDGDSVTLLADLLRSPEAPRLMLVLSGDASAESTALRRLGDSIRTLNIHVRVAGGDGDWLSLEELAPSERRLLEVATAAGEALRRDVLLHAAGLVADEAETALKELRRRGLLVTSSWPAGSFDLGPALDKERVLAGIGIAERRKLHQRIVDALGEHAAPDKLVRQLLAAGQRERASRAAEKAARAALETLSFERAAAFVELALSAGGASVDHERALRLTLGTALSACGRTSEAAEALMVASESGVSSDQRTELQQRAVNQLLIGGRVEQGLAALDRLLSEAGVRSTRSRWMVMTSFLFSNLWLRLRGLTFRTRQGELSERVRVRLDAMAFAVISLFVVDTMRAAHFCLRFLRLALNAGDQPRLLRAMSMYAIDRAIVGRGNARDVIARVRTMAVGEVDAWFKGIAASSELAVHYLMESAYRRALRKLVEVESHFLASKIPARWELDSARLYECVSLMWLGELDQARARAFRYVSEAERRGDRYAAAMLRLQCHWAWIADDDVRAAEHNLSRAEQAWVTPPGGFHVQDWLLLRARAEVALYRGDLQEASDVFERGRHPLRRSLLLMVPQIRLLTLQLEARIFAARAARLPPGDSERRRSIARARRVTHRMARIKIPLGQSMVPLLVATAHELDGDRAAAIAELQAAIAALEDIEAMAYAQAARRRLGEMLGGREGQKLVDEADTWLRAHGVGNPERMTSALAAGLGTSARQR